MATEGADSDGGGVLPLEHTAFFDIDTSDGYVHIEQSLGNQTLYTPEEAENIAEAILDAAESARRDGE